jgi:hypothetical protein
MTRTASIHTEARIKGGMPILIEAHVVEYEPHVGADIECVDLCWANTGAATTEAFTASLTDDDWNSVYDAIWEAWRRA